MLEAAIAAYEGLGGVTIDRRRVHLFNALEAAGFLGFRFGHAPQGLVRAHAGGGPGVGSQGPGGGESSELRAST